MEAIANGAASVAADRLDQTAATERLSDKERANLEIANSRIAQAHFDQELGRIEILQAQIRDKIKFLQYAYDYARWGYDKDNPYDQTYEVETPV